MTSLRERLTVPESGEWLADSPVLLGFWLSRRRFIKHKTSSFSAPRKTVALQCVPVCDDCLSLVHLRQQCCDQTGRVIGFEIDSLVLADQMKIQAL